MRRATTASAVLAAVTALPVAAGDKGERDDGTMQHGLSEREKTMHASNGAGATGQGIIRSVDVANAVVNLTHGPIPSLSWPEMTMDLPVASGVDLTALKPDDEVRFRVVLGADQLYRITSIGVLR